jgi:hypothetical protein
MWPVLASPVEIGILVQDRFGSRALERLGIDHAASWREVAAGMAAASDRVVNGLASLVAGETQTAAGAQQSPW